MCYYCKTLCTHAKYMGGGGRCFFIKVSYLQLTHLAGHQLGILQHWILGQKCKHTDVSSSGGTQKPDSRVFGMCSALD